MTSLYGSSEAIESLATLDSPSSTKRFSGVLDRLSRFVVCLWKSSSPNMELAMPLELNLVAVLVVSEGLIVMVGMRVVGGMTPVHIDGGTGADLEVITNASFVVANVQDGNALVLSVDEEGTESDGKNDSDESGNDDANFVVLDDPSCADWTYGLAPTPNVAVMT
eukprot:CAMPEP_0178730160 /NCGR_PEP_ID=MMETSP0699-20121125/29369_1 /TAXON_ID=265572 /ORGANISM="Extubocellulus spinifer, Strain CCMP396" /LENGTH=164 /DNA_ID=CAMNT_0020382163 /DNA_START=52 /DNA_END=544 /DNA_ORIENTATION=-